MITITEQNNKRKYCHTDQDVGYTKMIFVDHNSNSNKRRRRTNAVRFSEESNVSHSNTIMNKEECQRLWYSPSEYAEFRNSTAYYLRFAWQSEILAQQSNVNNVNPASLSAPIFTNVVQNVYTSCSATKQSDDYLVLTAQDTRHLQSLYAAGDNLEHLGLERIVARSVGKDRVARRKQVASLVQRVQQRLSKDDAWAGHSKDEILRSLCEEVSRTSRLFAQCLAYASLSCEV